MASIELKAVRKSFQSVEVIHGIDLLIEDGAFTVFVGPSGCGKSTLLRMVAGLEVVTSGEIAIDGQRCDHLMPGARGMAMVFQSYALYPHMSVEENLRFGLENQKLPKAEISKRLARAADILQISQLLKRRPNQLSGGQSQRVAIGRAIVKEPKAFLFDEPLSNLDAELRVKMRGELVALHQRLRATMIYVTHDQVEAMTMADKIVVLRDGRIEQTGSPVELYIKPANQFVAGFLGAPQMNFFAAKVSKSGQGVKLDANGIELILEKNGLMSITPQQKIVLGIRPEHINLVDEGPHEAIINQTEVLGAETIIHAQLATSVPVTVSLRGIAPFKTGKKIRMDFDTSNLHVFDMEGKRCR